MTCGWHHTSIRFGLFFLQTLTPCYFLFPPAVDPSDNGKSHSMAVDANARPSRFHFWQLWEKTRNDFAQRVYMDSSILSIRFGWRQQPWIEYEKIPSISFSSSSSSLCYRERKKIIRRNAVDIKVPLFTLPLFARCSCCCCRGGADRVHLIHL